MVIHHDKRLQLGSLIFSKNKLDNFKTLYWCVYKSKRSTRSVPENKVVTVANEINMAIAINSDMKNIVKQNIPLSKLIMRRLFFKFSGNPNSDLLKQLMINLKAIKHTYQLFEISNMAIIRSK